MKHWIFGYGSLIWRVDFPFHERRRATVAGWTRRFWQGSHDHRGTPEAPGRVATLVPCRGATCVGMAYLVDEQVFAHLDHREKNGYQRVEMDIRLRQNRTAASRERTVRGVTYVGHPGNPAFLGAAPLAAIAAQIAASAGPSGTNADYLMRLAAALDELETEDAHVHGLAACVAALTASQRSSG